jgi:hypothetical protein
VLIGAQVFVGVAAPSAATYQMYMGELVPVKHRGFWSAIVSVGTMPLQAFGPVIGKSPLQDVGWYRILILCRSTQTGH